MPKRQASQSWGGAGGGPGGLHRVGGRDRGAPLWHRLERDGTEAPRFVPKLLLRPLAARNGLPAAGPSGHEGAERQSQAGLTAVPAGSAGHGPPPGLRRHESGPSATPGAAAAGTGHAACVFRDARGWVPHVRCEGRVRTAAVTTRPRPLGWVKLTRCVAQGSGKSREPSKPDGALKPFFGALPPTPLPPCSSRSPLRVGWAQGAAAPHPGGLGLRF